MLEELTPQLLTVLVLIVVVLAPVVTLLVSLLLLGLYRRSVKRHMERRGGFEDQDDSAPAGGGTGPDQGDASSSAPAVRYRQMRRRPWSVAGHYLLAGAAFALVFSVAGPMVFPHRFGVPGYLTGFLYYAWPVVLAVLLVVPSSWRGKAAWIAGYFALFLLAVAWASTVLDQPAYRIGSITVPARSTANPVTNLRLWLFLDGVPTLLFLLCFNRWVRAVAPLVLGLATLGTSGLLVGLLSLSTPATHMAIYDTADALGVDVRLLELGAALLGVVLFVALGWGLARLAGRAYRRKRTSDQSLTLDALFLLFASYFAMWLILGGLKWVATAPIAFGAYKLSLALMRRLKPAPGVSARGLTFLRVFSLGRRSERLFDAVGSAWRHLGSVQTIIGPDVARSTVGLPQFLDFLSGKLGNHFVRDAASLERTLAERDRVADPDGRYRINSFFCRADSWQRVLPRLIEPPDVVLMDLRDFTEANEGCVHELRHLVRRVPLERCLMIVDETTDREFLDRILAETWSDLPADSPNRERSPDAAPLHPLRPGPAARRELLRSLCAAGS